MRKDVKGIVESFSRTSRGPPAEPREEGYNNVLKIFTTRTE
jgi:hypothetical protein